MMLQLGMLYKYDPTSSVPVLDPQCRSVTSVKEPLHAVRTTGFQLVDRNDKKSFEGTQVGDEIVSQERAVVLSSLNLSGRSPRPNISPRLGRPSANPLRSTNLPITTARPSGYTS